MSIQANIKLFQKVIGTNECPNMVILHHPLTL